MEKKYRKKPVVITALQWNGENNEEIEKFVGKKLKLYFDNQRKEEFLLIPTLESPHEASKGDFIIRGVKGEFYPCKPDIFDLTYEDDYTEPSPDSST